MAETEMRGKANRGIRGSGKSSGTLSEMSEGPQGKRATRKRGQGMIIPCGVLLHLIHQSALHNGGMIASLKIPTDPL